jgi:hypothetical protein
MLDADNPQCPHQQYGASLLSTEVSVRFDAVNNGTRLTGDHFGWDTIPQDYAARHGFSLSAFQQRLAEWCQVLLRSLAVRLTG